MRQHRVDVSPLLFGLGLGDPLEGSHVARQVERVQPRLGYDAGQLFPGAELEVDFFPVVSRRACGGALLLGTAPGAAGALALRLW